MSGDAAPSHRKRREGAVLRGAPAGFGRSPPVGRGRCPGSLLLGAQTGGSLVESSAPVPAPPGLCAQGLDSADQCGSILLLIRRWCALKETQSCGGPVVGGPVAPVGRWSEIRLSFGLEKGLGGHVVRNASESARIHPDPAKTVELRRISDQPRAEPSENDETQTRFGPAHPLPPGFTAEPAREAPEGRRTGRRALLRFRVLRSAFRVTCRLPETKPHPSAGLRDEPVPADQSRTPARTRDATSRFAPMGAPLPGGCAGRPGQPWPVAVK